MDHKKRLSKPTILPLFALALGMASRQASAVTGPCDIYQAGSTPCVAAHSTTRALYGAYAGSLYQVKRGKDSATKDIGVLGAGGFVNAKTQDDFCTGTVCTITILYDQSSKANHLTAAPGGGAVKTADKRVVATDEKLVASGNTVYGAKFKGGMGYRNNKTNGIATGDQPESMYMVTNGKFYNSLCCFDYGNAETTNNDDGNGTMEAIYFGNQRSYWGWGNVTPNSDGAIGPWVEADLENGLFAGPVFKEYTANTAVHHTYVTAMLKGGPNKWAIKGGNANSGVLKTMYEGIRPTSGFSGYNPMKKQGAIILGIGGDNSNGSQGIFHEGCMTSGYSTTATDDAVQANIILAGYGMTNLNPSVMARSVRNASNGSLVLGDNASGRLQIVDARGRSRILAVSGGKALGDIPEGLYQARLLDGSEGFQRLLVLP